MCSDDVIRRICERRVRRGHVLVMLDDDPTGSQAVRGVPVVTAWDEDTLDWAFVQPERAFFILTNTRSLTPAATVARLGEILVAVDRAATCAGAEFDLLLRGDSTLRGHYPLESDLLAECAAVAGRPYDALLLALAYPEAGRVTVDDLHLARINEAYIPVAETGYARDASFGYVNSDLKLWVAEKTAGRVAADSVASIGLGDIRGGGPGRVRELLSACHDTQPVIVNAESRSDLDVVALGAELAQGDGVRLLVRCAPSFVASLLGQEDHGALAADELPGRGRTGRGFVVVGSHVELTTRQVAALRRSHPDIVDAELDVARLLDGTIAWQDEVSRAAALLTQAGEAAVMLLSTSRRRMDGADREDSLAVAATVSAAVVDVVRRVVDGGAPRWVIAKGGITSSDVATDALHIRRAEVVGQLFPGFVSVWANSDSGPLGGLPYVVFAGNVGDDDSLAAAVDIMG